MMHQPIAVLKRMRLKVGYRTCSKAPVITLSMNYQPNTVSLAESSLDGNWIVSTSSDKTVRVWDATQGLQAFQVSSLPNFDDIANFMSFSSDGKHILASSRDYYYVWDAISGTCISKTRQSDFVRHERVMGVSANGWVRNSRTYEIICKLPRRAVTVYTITSSATSKESIALGFDGGQLLIIRFPTPVGGQRL